MTKSRPPLPHIDESWDRALCVVAHPDDLEYGAASAIARWTSQGKHVTYHLLTRGEAGVDGVDPTETARLREAEQRTGALEVGVEAVEFADGYRDGLIEYGLDLRRDIVRVIRRLRPDVLIGYAFTERIAGRTTNQADHRAVGLALLDAAKDCGNRWLFPELLDEGLEPWPHIRFVAFSNAADPTHAVDVGDHLDRGIRSLEAHQVYLNGLGDAAENPSEFLTTIASWNGARLGVRFAAAFDVFEIATKSSD